MEILLTYRHRAVTAEDVAFIRALIATHPQAKRRELSRLLCAAWNWVQANGAPRDMVCRGLMLALHRAGFIELPAVRCPRLNPLARSRAQRQAPRILKIETALRGELGAARPLGSRLGTAHGARSAVQQPALAIPLFGLQPAGRGASEVSDLGSRTARGVSGLQLGAATSRLS